MVSRRPVHVTCDVLGESANHTLGNIHDHGLNMNGIRIPSRPVHHFFQRQNLNDDANSCSKIYLEGPMLASISVQVASVPS
jgi:hypothetical protein